MVFSNHSLLGLGVFFSYQDAEVALEKLKEAGFLSHQLSFLAKSSDRHDDLATASLDSRYLGSLPSATNPIAPSSAANSMISGLSGLVARPSQLELLGTGSVVAGGRLSAIVSSLNSFAGSSIEALRTLGIPEQTAALYSDRIGRGDCLIGVEGSGPDILEAEEILHHCQINHWQIYEIAAAEVPAEQPVSPPASFMAAAPAVSTPPGPAGGLPYESAGESDTARFAVGAFRHYPETEAALRDLQQMGFPLERISVITRNGDRIKAPSAVKQIDGVDSRREGADPIAQVNLYDGDRSQMGKGATAGALAGGSVGGLTGLLVGLGTLAIPGVGPIFLAGTAGTAIAAALAGSAIGAAAGGLLGTLVGMGIPEDRAKVYHERLAAGQYIIVATGTEAEILSAEKIFSSYGIEEWGIYPAFQSSLQAENVGQDAVWEAQLGVPVGSYSADRRLY
ncbi:MAG: hypothetical protein F6K04_11835 [Leptolyngbya sp. SIO4C5]|nr:hypothetical protein [Leptolyngbya sp. SIO4C5]